MVPSIPCAAISMGAHDSRPPPRLSSAAGPRSRAAAAPPSPPRRGGGVGRSTTGTKARIGDASSLALLLLLPLLLLASPLPAARVSRRGAFGAPLRPGWDRFRSSRARRRSQRHFSSVGAPSRGISRKRRMGPSSPVLSLTPRPPHPPPRLAPGRLQQRQRPADAADVRLGPPRRLVGGRRRLHVDRRVVRRRRLRNCDQAAPRRPDGHAVDLHRAAVGATAAGPQQERNLQLHVRTWSVMFNKHDTKNSLSSHQSIIRPKDRSMHVNRPSPPFPLPLPHRKNLARRKWGS